MEPTLRVLAVTAPHWPKRPIGIDVRSLTAGSPFSLQNAVRQAAGNAEHKIGAWADSNWTTLGDRQNSVLLLEFMDEARTSLAKILPILKPNLVFIGAMTLGFPGAVEIAKIVREEFGEDCLIILGGKHINETLRGKKNTDDVDVLPCSPLELMRNGSLDMVNGLPLFDLVISGDGEEVITNVGEMVHATLTSEKVLRDALSDKKMLKRSRGQWIAGWVEEGEILTLSSPGMPLDFDLIPTSPSIFGLQSAFPVFDSVPTGHAYSDMGRGCKFDCHFCSERNGLNGKFRRDMDPIGRLYQHFEDIWKAGGSGKHGPVGAFVEDSILLGGEVYLISLLIKRLEHHPLHQLRIGCQMSANDVIRLDDKKMLHQLKEVGFDYVAFGMETVNEGVALLMSKHGKRGLWTETNRIALRKISNAGLRAGVYVLWGLGESQREREIQLKQIHEWKKDYCGQPVVISLNWATLHPSANPEHELILHWPQLNQKDVSIKPQPNFLEWGTSEESDRLPYFVELFGEASEIYPYYFDIIPSKNELVKLRAEFLQVMEVASEI